MSVASDKGESAGRRRGDTRERLLELAEAAVLAKGIAATSIDELIVAAGITKSGFFYHFKDKNELAKVLIVRYAERHNELLDDLFRRSDELHEDPLHAFLIGIKLFAEAMDALPETHPGCLVASFCYQDQRHNREIRALVAQSFLTWRRRIRDRLELIAARYPPLHPVDLDHVADMATTLVEGGIILSRALDDRTLLARQVLFYRDFVRALFLHA